MPGEKRRTWGSCFLWYGVFLVAFLLFAVTRLPGIHHPSIQDELDAMHTWYCGQEGGPNYGKDPCVAYRISSTPHLRSDPAQHRKWEEITRASTFQVSIDEMFIRWCDDEEKGRVSRTLRSRSQVCNPWRKSRPGLGQSAGEL